MVFKKGDLSNEVHPQLFSNDQPIALTTQDGCSVALDKLPY